MRTILVTGSTGFIGSHLVKALAEEKHYLVIGAVEDDNGFTDRYECNDYLQTIPNCELLKGNAPRVDVVVNCAFARSNDPHLLANALDFTAKLAAALKRIGTGSLINISSQGVYKRLPEGELQTEDSEIAPIDLYSMAKYAAEKIFLASACAAFITNVRLASINMKQRFLFTFTKKIFEGEPIVLTAPYQNAALLDVKDAVSGLQALIRLPDQERKGVYNLGIGKQMTILDYASTVINTMKAHGYSGELIVQESNQALKNSGMDCTRMMHDTRWNPTVTSEKMIEEYYTELLGGVVRL